MDNNAYEKFLAGDNSALLEIIREYKNGLTMYVNNYVHDLNTADELCCETFVRLADKKPKFRGKSSFKTFLYGIGRNVALEFLRRNKNHALEPLDDFCDVADETDIEKNFLTKERNEQLYSAIKKLKSEYAQVLWLMYFEDMSINEISVVMKKSASAVKVLLHRARTALKTELTKEGFEYENS